MRKISLKIAAELIERAATHGKLMGAIWDSIAGGSKNSQMPPVLRSLRGSLKDAELKAYGAHLAQKHQ
jgi:hypothetical protein